MRERILGHPPVPLEEGRLLEKILDEKFVRSFFPDSYAHWLGVLKYEIRRKRTRQDPHALVPYVLMSGLFSKPELAWKDAAAKLKP